MRPSTAEAIRPLSVAMKEGSAAEHDAAEQSPFVTELLAGRVSRECAAFMTARFERMSLGKGATVRFSMST